MRQVSIRILAVLLVLIGLCTACKKNAEFTVKGVVADAAGEVMYLENVGVSSVTRMDSVKLTSAGEFQFKQPRPAYPDFYRLRLNNQLINFSVPPPTRSRDRRMRKRSSRLRWPNWMPTR